MKYSRWSLLVLLLTLVAIEISAISHFALAKPGSTPSIKESGSGVYNQMGTNLSGPVMRLPFDGNTLDVSGHGNSGFSSLQAYTTDHAGNPNSAYLFNGVNNEITVANSASINPSNQLTMTMWLRVESIHANYMPVVVKGGPVVGDFANREFALYTKQNFSLWYPQWKSAGDGLGQHECNGDHHSYVVGEWVFFACVVDRVNHFMRIYANGVLTEENNIDSYSTFNNDGHSMIIGWSEEAPNLGENSRLIGAMDDLRLYNQR